MSSSLSTCSVPCFSWFPSMPNTFSTRSRSFCLLLWTFGHLTILSDQGTHTPLHIRFSVRLWLSIGTELVVTSVLLVLIFSPTSLILSTGIYIIDSSTGGFSFNMTRSRTVNLRWFSHAPFILSLRCTHYIFLKICSRTAVERFGDNGSLAWHPFWLAYISCRFQPDSSLTFSVNVSDGINVNIMNPLFF